MTKQSRYDDPDYIAFREMALEKRLKQLSHVPRERAAEWARWLRSDMQLRTSDREELAAMIDSLLFRGRQPGPSHQLAENTSKMVAEVHARGSAEKAASGRQRLRRGRRDEIAEEVHAAWASRVSAEHLPDLEYLRDRVKKGR